MPVYTTGENTQTFRGSWTCCTALYSTSTKYKLYSQLSWRCSAILFVELIAFFIPPTYHSDDAVPGCCQVSSFSLYEHSRDQTGVVLHPVASARVSLPRSTYGCAADLSADRFANRLVVPCFPVRTTRTPGTQQWQKRYNRCVKKFANGYVKGEARSEKREDCLERFDDFQKCVLVSRHSSVETTSCFHMGTVWPPFPIARVYTCAKRQPPLHG